MASATALSAHDAKVLQTLFDPESTLQRPLVQIEGSGLSAVPSLAPEQFAKIKQQELETLRSINSVKPSIQSLRKAADVLREIIAEYPAYISAYANLGQVLSLEILQGVLCDETGISYATTIYAYLTETIEKGQAMTNETTISRYCAETLSAAHTHRGFVLMRAAQEQRDGTERAQVFFPGLSESLRECNADELEELANADFQKGAAYGNDLSKQMAVKTNPYAKLCGAIVQESFRDQLAMSER